MNKDIKRKIIEEVFKLSKIEDRKQDITEKYYEEMYPDSFPPILERPSNHVLNILKIIFWKEIPDWIEYFLYEAPSFYPKCIVRIWDKKITIKDYEDAIDFITKHID